MRSKFGQVHKSLVIFAMLAGFALAAEPGAVVRSGFIYGEPPPTPQCHASTIVETGAGTLAVAWFGGTHEKHPDVGIWVSRQVDGQWSDPVEVANGVQFLSPNGEKVRHPSWNPVLFQPRDGPLMLFYKVGPSPLDWWGEVRTSNDDGQTWSEARRLPEGILGPIKNKPIELPDGTIICPSSEESPLSGWTIHFERTRDLGRSWQRIGPINSNNELNAIQPSILVHADGRLQLLARTRNDVIATSWSDDLGMTWSRLEATALANPSSGTDAVTLRDGRHLLVYNPSIRRPDGRSGPRTPLVVAVSSDGIAWRDVLVLENDEAQHGYSYPAIIQSSDGHVHITYTWRRTNIRHVVIDPRTIK